MLDLDFVRVQLDEAYERLADEYVKTSVLSVVREYAPKDKADMESWALFSATLDFQVSVTHHLIPMLKNLLRSIEVENLKFIDIVNDEEVALKILSSFKWNGHTGFKHRFLNINHVLALLKGMRDLIQDHSSIGNLIKELYEQAMSKSPNEPLEYVIRKFAGILRSYVFKYIGNPQALGMLIPDPDGNSAFKRLCLYFRWMVRPYPDLHVWNFIDKRYLYLSLDNGVIRVLGRVFGIKITKPTWDSVRYVTSIFRQINPEDPAKYDYVLSRPSIMGYCKKDPSKNVCVLCPLSSFCPSSKLPEKIRGAPLRSRRESMIFKRFLNLYRDKLGISDVWTEYPLGDYSIDAVMHSKDCTWYVAEVEERLTDTAIGQVIKYKILLYRYKKVIARPLIICREADNKLVELLRTDAGIQVFMV